MHQGTVATAPNPQGHALFLIDEHDVPEQSLQLMETLPESMRRIIRRYATALHIDTGKLVFEQGRPHSGIFVIEKGSVRTFYASPTGKEITLAYWKEGNFVGGPELFGRGYHVWSAEAAVPSVVSWIPGSLLQTLALQNSELAMGLIDALIVKGKCYSSLAQILGTRPARGRLAELLLALAEREGEPRPSKDARVPRHVTHEQLAAIIGSTRQWVTATLSRFERDGLVSVGPEVIVIRDTRALRDCYASD